MKNKKKKRKKARYQCRGHAQHFDLHFAQRWKDCWIESIAVAEERRRRVAHRLELRIVRVDAAKLLAGTITSLTRAPLCEELRRRCVRVML